MNAPAPAPVNPFPATPAADSRIDSVSVFGETLYAVKDEAGAPVKGKDGRPVFFNSMTEAQDYLNAAEVNGHVSAIVDYVKSALETGSDPAVVAQFSAPAKPERTKRNGEVVAAKPGGVYTGIALGSALTRFENAVRLAAQIQSRLA